MGMIGAICRLALATIVLAALGAAAQPLTVTAEGFDARIGAQPGPVIVDGRLQWLYELHLSNFVGRTLTVREVRVYVDQKRQPAWTLRGDELQRRLVTIGADETVALAGIAPGRRAVIYLDFLSGDAAALSRTLRHEVDYLDGDETRTLSLPPVPVAVPATLRLGPPLRGGPWVAVHSPDWPRGHRRVVIATGGRARIPGRFAIDWVKTDAQGKTSRGDADRVADTLGYGDEVLAVDEAVVALVRDDMPEPELVSARRKHALTDAAGNFVSLRLSDGRYAVYEHLKPGSIRVRAGDHVRRGQVIAALGFTGDSTGPHLHFHVADAAEPAAGEGLPFALSGWRELGRYGDIGALGRTPWPAQRATRLRRNEWPGWNVVVEFDE